MSGCSCVIDVDVDPECAARVFKRRTPRARTEHLCNECNKPIRPGEQYEYFTGLYENGWETVKTCAVCMEIRDCYCCQFYFGMVWEDIYNYFEEEGDLKICMLEKLSPAARAVMIDWIDKTFIEPDLEDEE